MFQENLVLMILVLLRPLPSLVLLGSALQVCCLPVGPDPPQGHGWGSGSEEPAGRRSAVGLAAPVPPAGQHLAAVHLYQPAGGSGWLALLAGGPGVQQRGSPGEVHHPGTGEPHLHCYFTLNHLTVMGLNIRQEQPWRHSWFEGFPWKHDWSFEETSRYL